MIGPVVLVVAGAVAGFALGGWTGLVAGIGLGGLGVLMVVLGAATWANQIGKLLVAEDARASAPCPPGFTRVCSFVYDRLLG